MTKLSDENILTQVHYMPAPMHPYYQAMNYNIDNYQNSLDYYNETLSLPLYYTLSEQEQDKVINLLKSILE